MFNLRKYIVIIICFFALYSKAQTGSISGNAFWKYNDFIGTKPDAGSDVLLFYRDTTKPPEKTICDANGNFVFDGVDTGYYLIVIVSKNTTSKPEDRFDELRLAPLKNYLGFDIRELNPVLYDTIISNMVRYNDLNLQVGTKSKHKEEKEIEEQALNAYEDYQKSLLAIIKYMPLNEKTIYFLIGLQKLKIKEVHVKNGQNATVVADFGLTSF